MKKQEIQDLSIRIYSIIMIVVTIWHCLHEVFQNRVITLSMIFYIFLQSVCIICFFVLVRYPRKWYLFTIAHFLEGTLISFHSTILYSGVLAGLIILLGFVIAFSYGFFKEYFKTKCSILLLYVLVLPFFNQEMSMSIRINNSLQSVFVICCLYFIILFVSTYLEEFISIMPRGVETKNGKIELTDYGFNYRELFCIQSTIAGKPYKWIANELGCSESCVKHIMVLVFQKFKVTTREQFVGLILQYEIRYPKEYLQEKEKNTSSNTKKILETV